MHACDLGALHDLGAQQGDATALNWKEYPFGQEADPRA